MHYSWKLENQILEIKDVFKKRFNQLKGKKTRIEQLKWGKISEMPIKNQSVWFQPCNTAVNPNDVNDLIGLNIITIYIARSACIGREQAY